MLGEGVLLHRERHYSDDVSAPTRRLQSRALVSASRTPRGLAQLVA
jgi:hypothetical protein